MMVALRSRLIASGLHLAISGVVALAAGAVVFLLWYPQPFDDMAGGFSLFFLVVAVDVVMGPLLTAVVFNRAKPKGELVRDLGVIGVMQICALVYGLNSIYEARPVLLSFEVDRFRLISAADVQTEELMNAPKGYQTLSLSGPRLVAAPKPQDPDEQLRSIDLGLKGIDLSMVPRYWQPYEPHAAQALRRARPVDLLTQRNGSLAVPLAKAAERAGVPVEALRFLPLQSRRASWVILLEPTHGQPVGYLPVDGFF
jgi:hypothetical protein